MTTTMKEKVTCECPKCGGSGYIPAYAGIADGVCFKCSGSGRVTYRQMKAGRYTAINAMHCRTLAEAQAFRVTEFNSRFPGLYETLSSQRQYDVQNGCGNLKDIVLGS